MRINDTRTSGDDYRAQRSSVRGSKDGLSKWSRRKASSLNRPWLVNVGLPLVLLILVPAVKADPAAAPVCPAGFEPCWLKISQPSPLGAAVHLTVTEAICRAAEMPVEAVDADLQSLCTLPSCANFNGVLPIPDPADIFTQNHTLTHTHTLSHTVGDVGGLQIFAPDPASLCAKYQQFGCDPENRFSPSPAATAKFLCRSDPPPSPPDPLPVPSADLSKATDLNDAPSGRAPLERLSVNEFAALRDCGATHFDDAPALLASGGLQYLGDYTTCRETSHEFCTIKYFDLLLSGRCLPKTCSPFQMAVLNDWLCAKVATLPQTAAGHDFSCLDFLDQIPLDYCLYHTLLGCNRFQELSIIFGVGDSDDGKELTSVQQNAEGKVEAHRFLHTLMIGKSALEDEHPKSSAVRSEILAVFEAVSQRWNSSEGSLTDEAASELSQYLQYSADPSSCSVPAGGHIHHNDNHNKHGGPGHERRGKKDGKEKAGGTSEGGIDRKDAKSFHNLSYAMYCNHSPDAERTRRERAVVAAVLGSVFLLLPTVALFAKQTRLPPAWDSLKNLLGVFGPAFNWTFMMSKARKMAASPEARKISLLKTLSMAWVLFGHAFSFGFMSSVTKNVSHFPEIVASLFFQFVYSGQYAVDTFFFLSAFLTIRSVDKIFLNKNSNENQSPIAINPPVNSTIIANANADAGDGIGIMSVASAVGHVQTLESPADHSPLQTPPTGRRSSGERVPRGPSPENEQPIRRRRCRCVLYTFALKVGFFLRAVALRYLRLVPLLAFFMFTAFFVAPYFVAEQPLFPILDATLRDGRVGGCKKFWFANLLFINNLLPPAKTMVSHTQSY